MVIERIKHFINSRKAGVLVELHSGKLQYWQGEVEAGRILVSPEKIEDKEVIATVETVPIDGEEFLKCITFYRTRDNQGNISTQVVRTYRDFGEVRVRISPRSFDQRADVREKISLFRRQVGNIIVGILFGYE